MGASLVVEQVAGQQALDATAAATGIQQVVRHQAPVSRPLWLWRER